MWGALRALHLAAAAAAAAAYAAAGSEAGCWREGGFRRNLCCKYRLPECFSNEWPHERCCSEFQEFVASAPEHATGLPRPALLPRLDPAKVPSVDLVVRTYYKTFEQIELLLRSVEIYWPKGWGRVIVSLDGESELDRACCTLIRQKGWAECMLEDLPLYYGNWSDQFNALGYSGSHKGMLRKELSLLRADEWTTAEYVAVVDSDVVFVTFGLPELLFDHSGERPVPIVFGRSSAGPFQATVAAMGISWQAEFMDSFPLIIHRDDLKLCRKYIAQLFCEETQSPGCRSPRAFYYGFFALQRDTRAMTGGTEFPSWHSVIGSFIWQFRRKEYSWAIQYGHYEGVPLPLTCPFIRTTSHVSYHGTPENPHFVTMRATVGEIKGSDNIAREKLGGAVFTRRALRAMMAGVCAVRWRKILKDGSVSDPPAPGFLMVREKECQDVRNLSEMVLMSGYDRPWTEEEAAYCGGRQPAALLESYRELLKEYAFDF